MIPAQTGPRHHHYAACRVHRPDAGRPPGGGNQLLLLWADSAQTLFAPNASNAGRSGKSISIRKADSASPPVALRIIRILGMPGGSGVEIRSFRRCFVRWATSAMGAPVCPVTRRETAQNLGVSRDRTGLRDRGWTGRGGLGRRGEVAGHRGADPKEGHRPVVHPQVLDGLMASQREHNKDTDALWASSHGRSKMIASRARGRRRSLAGCGFAQFYCSNWLF
jgi:hypothetical protein